MSGKAKDELARVKVQPTKERGQNFIINPFVTESILQFGAPSAEEHLVEIGPGLGALTASLVQVAPLTVIEIERRFCHELAQKFPALRIINADVCDVSFAGLGQDLVVFGNLPYSRSTDIIFHLIKERAAMKRAVVMVQREFAERIAAEEGGRDYGSLSVAVQRWAEARLGPIIPGDAFHPPTEVESILLELTFRKKPLIEVKDERLFERVVRGAFSKRRKKLLNSLLGAQLGEEPRLLAALERAGISPEARAEQLSIEQFGALADALVE